MGITKYFEKMHQDFLLFRQIGDEFPKFQPGVTYDGFLALRKIS